MTPQRDLPFEFLQSLQDLESSYLAEDDPIRQSGFGGGPIRWRAEREPILNAIDGDGDLLDLCCANGFLLECLMAWARARGLALIPHGLDFGPRLIELAKGRLPAFSSNFFVGNAWNWEPLLRFRYVYSLYDCVPAEYLAEYVRRVLQEIVAPGGRLILGAYGSRSRGIPPFDVAGFLGSLDLPVIGTAQGGSPQIAAFAWVDRGCRC